MIDDKQVAKIWYVMGNIRVICNRSSTDKTTRWHNEVTTDVTQFAFTHGGQVRANVSLFLWTSSVFSFLNFWPTKELIIFSTSDTSPRLYHTTIYIVLRETFHVSLSTYGSRTCYSLSPRNRSTHYEFSCYFITLSCQPHHDITLPEYYYWSRFANANSANRECFVAVPVTVSPCKFHAFENWTNFNSGMSHVLFLFTVTCHC